MQNERGHVVIGCPPQQKFPELGDQLKFFAGAPLTMHKLQVIAETDRTDWQQQVAKREIADHFARQLEPWQMWGKPPEECGVEIMLTPYEVADLGEGKFGWIQDEDRTHIIHAPTIPPGARIPPAACGAQVNAKCFISTKANIEPSCKGCKEVWERRYKGK
jgi:hypothetical protein